MGRSKQKKSIGKQMISALESRRHELVLAVERVGLQYSDFASST